MVGVGRDTLLQGKVVMKERIKLVLLFAIALGLWVNVFANWTPPVAAQKNADQTLRQMLKEVRDIGNDVRRIRGAVVKSEEE